MILGALDDAGGQAYLAEQAHQNPVACLTLARTRAPARTDRDTAGRDYPGLRIPAASGARAT